MTLWQSMQLGRSPVEYQQVERMPRQPALDLYAELRVSTDASHAQILAAFRREAKASHPDLSTAAGSTARMARLNVAREILFDPDRRAEYDRSRGLLSSVRGGRPRERTVSPRRPGPPRDGKAAPHGGQDTGATGPGVADRGPEPSTCRDTPPVRCVRPTAPDSATAHLATRRQT